MMLHTTEFHDILAQFKKDAKTRIRTGSQGFAMEDKKLWPKQIYFCDSVANDAFKMYLLGVSLGKIL